MKQEEYNTYQLSKWADTIKKKYNYTCQHCGKEVSGHHCHAHHIKSIKEFPSEMYNLENGLCLCIGCHNKVHKTGNITSDETKKKISENNGRYWKDRLHSDETKKKIVDALTGIKRSDEARRNNSEAQKGYGIRLPKPINQISIETGEVIATYPSIMAAERATGIHSSGISLVCNGKGNTYKKFKWEFVR